MPTLPPPTPPAALAGIVHTDPVSLRAGAGSRGPVWFPPRAVARPRDEAEVAAVVSWCDREGLALTPRGGGTGMPGGNVGPGVVLDLTALDSIRPTVDGGVEAGAGAVAARVDGVARSRGRELPALPSSSPWCTAGGMVATDAAGARSFHHGPVHAWVRRLRLVRASGGVEEWRRADAPTGAPPWGPLRDALAALPLPPAPSVRKNASGYAIERFLASGDPIQLVVGSEGTLAVVTAVEFDTVPIPARTAVILLGLPDLDLLPAVAERARRTGATACEYFGRRLLELGGLVGDARLAGLAPEAGALLIEYAGAPGVVEAGLAAWEGGGPEGAPCRTASDPDEVQGLWGLRHSASPAIAEAAGHRRSLQFIEDGVVPVSALPTYVRAVTGALARQRLDGVIFGHAGDGNLHVNPLVDLGDPDWERRVRAVLDEVTETVVGLGGTLSGEHGDGRLRAPLLERIWGPAHREAFRRVKETLDPRGILNPGVVLPLPGQDPLTGFARGPDLQRGHLAPVASA